MPCKNSHNMVKYICMEKKIIILIVACIAIICTMSAGCIVPEPTVEKLVIDYKIIDTANSIGDETPIEKVYDFSYQGRNWHIVAQVPTYRYNNYVNEKYLVLTDWLVPEYLRSEPTAQRAFLGDEYVENVVEQFKTQNGVLTDKELIEVLTYFVQTQIEYVTDMEHYNDAMYIAYPMQALINSKGDCNCKSALLASLYMHAGYDSLVVHILPKDLTVGHVIVGISCEKLDFEHPTKNIEHEGKSYYLVESTVFSFIGQGYYIDPNYVEEFRLVDSKGYQIHYEYDVILSIHDYINNTYSFTHSDTGEWVTEQR